ncbi:DUF2325 domain-containing protein [Desulfotomaculum nigrificans]|uniref:DUF2325 domain-containing protein n=1 Tax=Desulfotomaculum nigrificans TaxID=1565 RepID=UPI0001FAE567|nr:DUF2325 domain-containing protein [Desulfotomaculum nigrificans]MDA8235917.1 DUF2325 domain-containing protein [Clostridia bacterium]
MTCLIVGADSIGSKEKDLRDMGFREVIHWNGRTLREPKQLPSRIHLVVVITGFINHNYMHKVKKLAKKSGIRVIYIKRGLSELTCAIS